MLNSPLTANLVLSYRCNLHCPFCFEANDRNQHKRELTTEQWCELIDKLSEMKIFNLLLTGGEIFFHPGIWTILEHVVRGRMRYRLLTNGTLITEETVARLKSLDQCDSIQISLDGMEDDNDAVRGKGMFRKSLHAINLLANAGFKVNVNTVVSLHNYRNIPDFARYLSSLPITKYRLNAIHEDEACKNNPDSAFLTEEHLAECISFFYGKWDQYPKLSRYLGVFLPLAYLQNHYPLRDPNGCIFCNNPYFMISVHPDGTITPCVDRKIPELGHYPQNTIQEVWNADKYNDFRKAVHAGKQLTNPKCAGCHYAYYCRRFCPNLPSLKFCLVEVRKHLIARGITDV